MSELYTHRPNPVAAFQWDGVSLVKAKLFVADWLGDSFSVQVSRPRDYGKTGRDLLELVRSTTINVIYPDQWLVVPTDASRFDVLDDTEFRTDYQQAGAV